MIMIVTDGGGCEDDGDGWWWFLDRKWACELEKVSSFLHQVRCITDEKYFLVWQEV